MPHKPRRHGYETLDIYLKTQDSAKQALTVQQWNRAQQRYLKDFTEYGLINKVEFTRNGKIQIRFRNKEDGRFVKGY